MRHIKGQDHVQTQINQSRRKPPPILASIALIAYAVAIVAIAYGVLSYSSNHSSSRGNSRAAIQQSQKSNASFGAVFPVIFGSVLIAWVATSLLGIPPNRITLKRLLREFKRNDEVGKLAAGREGERAIALKLSVLDERWILFSGVVLDGMYGDIDHVLVGPTGIFAIEAKHWSGSIYYNSETNSWTRQKMYGALEESKDPARQIKGTSSILERALGKNIQPCVVFTHPTATVSGKHRDVAILTLNELLPWIRSRNTQLSKGDINETEQRLRKQMRT